MDSSNTYKIGASNYLKRARKQLDSHSYEGLFYAAFELRCSIESRMKEYLENHPHIPSKRKKQWKLSSLDKTVLRYFGDTNRITRVIINQAEPPNETLIFYYTPVTPELISIGQKLGDLLHAQTILSTKEEEFWKTTREMLEKAYKLSEIASKGTLMGPPLWEEEGKTVTMIFSPYSDKEMKAYQKIIHKGSQFTAEIKHLDEFPEE